MIIWSLIQKFIGRPNAQSGVVTDHIIIALGHVATQVTRIFSPQAADEMAKRLEAHLAKSNAELAKHLEVMRTAAEKAERMGFERRKRARAEADDLAKRLKIAKDLDEQKTIILEQHANRAERVQDALDRIGTAKSKLELNGRAASFEVPNLQDLIARGKAAERRLLSRGDDPHDLGSD